MKHGSAVVTGGSAGCGEAICKRLLGDGYQVISVARRAPNWKDPNLHFFQADLADKPATDAVVAQVVDQFAITNILHNAGVIRPALLGDVKAADLDYLSNLHLYAGIAFAQALGLDRVKLCAAFGLRDAAVRVRVQSRILAIGGGPRSAIP